MFTTDQHHAFAAYRVRIRVEIQSLAMSHLPPALPPHLEGQQINWLSKTTSARFLGNPLVWSLVTGLFIVLGYLWLEYYARPYSERLAQNHTEDELIGSPNRGSWNPDIYRNIETESLMNITRQADDIRAEGYRTAIDHQNKIQPLLDQARNYLEQEQYVGSDGENAWQLYQRILEIEPGHKIASSGQSQIISLLQENAEFAVDDEQYAEAEHWLNQLDTILPGAPFQSDLRLLISDLIAENIALEQAAQRKTERDQLLDAALQDATSALNNQPPALRAAYDLYQRAIELEQDNADAIAGLKDIHTRRIKIAKTAIKDRDFALAQTQIDRLQQTGAKQSDIDALQAALKKARTPVTPAGKAEPAPKQDQIPAKPVAPVADQATPASITASGTEKTPESTTEISQPDTRSTEQTSPPQTSIQVPGWTRPQVEEIVIQAPPVSQVETVSAKPASDIKSMLNRGINDYYAGNYQRAFTTLHPLAEKNIARAQFRIGMMYYKGRTVVKNEDLARQWIARALPAILQAAQAGTAWAQADLGTAYELGVGVIQDPARAATWYLKSAKQGYAGAQANLGVLYGNGVGVKYDRQTALYWLKQAAAQGDKVAQQNLRALNAR